MVPLSAVLAAMLVGFSRLYNGVHTLDQIILGWEFGVWQAVLFEYEIREKLIKHLSALHDTPLNYQAADYSKLKQRSTLIIAFALATIILTFQYVESHFTVPQDWKDRLLSKCGESGVFTFNSASLVASGIVFIPYTAYLGLVWLSEARN